MKIIILGTRGFPNVQGGVEKHCQELAPRLVNSGCEVTVFTRDCYVDKSFKEFKGVKLVALPAMRSKFLEAFFHTLLGVFAARRIKPDILHIHAIGPAFFALLARMLGMKVVVTTHGSNYMHLKWGRIARLALRFFECVGMVFARDVIAISKGIGEEIRRKYQRKAVVIPNGVLIPQIASTEDFLRKFGLRKGKYFLAVGRFVPEKGFHDLIRAFGRLGDSRRAAQNKNWPQRSGGHEHDQWKLVIAGDADHENKYSQELKRQAKENPDVVMTGFLTGQALQEMYSHAGLFVLPSYYEGLPIVLLEAMSYGLTCLASDIAPHKEVGLKWPGVFKPGDICELSGAMEYYMNRHMSEGDKSEQIRKIKENYDWEKVATATRGVYERVLNPGWVASAPSYADAELAAVGS